jgi:hypothetical protein
LINRLVLGQVQRQAGLELGQAGATDLAFLVDFERSVEELRSRSALTKNHPRSR